MCFGEGLPPPSFLISISQTRHVWCPLITRVSQNSRCRRTNQPKKKTNKQPQQGRKDTTTDHYNTKVKGRG